MSHLPSPPQQAPRRPPTTSPTMFTSSFATTNTTSRRGPVGSLLRKPSKYTPHLNDGKSTLSTPPRGVPAHAHAQTIAASSPEYESDSSISLMHAAAGGFALNTPEKDRYSRRAITPPTSRLPHPKRGRSVPPPSTITESKTTVRRAHDHSCNKPAVRNAASAASVSKSSLTPQTRGPAVDAYPTPPASANGGTKVKDVLNGVGKKKRPPLPAPALSSTKLDVYTEPDVTEASETEDAGRQRTRTETASTLDIFQKLENIVSDARRAIRISPEDPHHRRDGPLHILTDDTAVLGNVDVRRSPTTRISKQPGSVLGDKSNITMRPGMRRNGSVMTSSALEKENRPDRAAVVQPIAPAAKGLELRGRTRTCPAAVEGSKSNVDNSTVPSLSPNEAKPSVRQPTGLVVRKSRAQAPRFNLVPGTTSIAVVPTAMRVILQEVEAFQREWVQMFVDMEHESEGGKDEREGCVPKIFV